MKIKSVILLSIILLFLLCISTVNAENIDSIATDNNNEVIDNNTIKYEPGIDSKDLVKYYRNDSQFDVTIIGEDGNPVDKGINVDFILKTKTYSIKTNEIGISTLNINLLPGNYQITIKYANYTNVNNIKVLPPIITDNFVKYYNNGSNFEAKIIGEHGIPIDNAKVSFVVKGTTYTRYTNVNGIASLPIGLNPGSYTITTKYDKYSVNNNIMVLSPIVTKDLVKYYNNGSKFEAKIIGITTPTKVTFTVKKATYTKYTDKNGIASLPIGLSPGSYTITTKYDKYSVNNNIIVLSPIVTKDLVKYYNNGSKFEAKIIGITTPTKVTFTVKKATYTKYTDKNGIASLPIGLSPGSYTITTKYDKYSVNNNINVYYKIITSDIVKYYKNDTAFTITIADGNDNPIKGASVTCNYNGNVLKAITTATGTLKLIVNSDPGEYSVITSCAGKTIKNTVKVLKPFESNDLVKYLKNDSQFNVKVMDSHGNPVNNGVKVDVKVNNKVYPIYTDKNGIATLKINLNPGTYTLTTTYLGFSEKNTVKVLPRITSSDVTTTINEDFGFKIKILDGQGKPLQNGEVKFTLNGKESTTRTNNDGIATFTGKLNAGNYVIHYNADNIVGSNKIKVTNIITLETLKWGTGGDVTKNPSIKANMPKSDLITKIIQAAKSGTPLITLKGAEEGKTIFMNSGTHGNEISSQVAMLKMIAQLETTPVKGTVYIMPFICPKITELNIRRYNGDDLNRVAHISGKVSNKVLNLIVSLKCEAYSDFHCTQSPGVPGKDVIMGCASPTKNTVNLIKKVSQLSGFPTIIYEKAGNPYLGAIQDHANIKGIPSITCEVISKPGYMDKGSDVKSLKQINAYLKYNEVII